MLNSWNADGKAIVMIIEILGNQGVREINHKSQQKRCWNRYGKRAEEQNRVHNFGDTLHSESAGALVEKNKNFNEAIAVLTKCKAFLSMGL